MRRFASIDPGIIGTMLVALAAMLVSCATGSTPPDDTPTGAESSPPPPGADRWEEGALELPARSPVVGVVRLGALLDNLRRFRSWIAEEPAMFGENGERFVQQFRSGWNQISRGLGFDPLSRETPGRVGLDSTRPIYVGLYPASKVGADFVDRIEGAAREAADLDAGAPIAPALRAMNREERPIPSHFSSTLLENGEASPTAGLRAILPIEDAATFGERFAAAAKTLGYREMSADEVAEIEGVDGDKSDGADSEPTAFYSQTSQWPALLVRPGKEWLKIDIVFRDVAVGGRPEVKQPIDRARAALSRLLAVSDSGRPAAPRPPDQPLFGVAADQAGTGTFIRMQAYRGALQTASRAAADRRNRALVESLTRAATVGEDWSRASDILTGTSYSMYGASTETDESRAFRLTSTLFGPLPADKPDIDSVKAGLGVDDRGFGAALDFDPLFDSAWQKWLSLEDAEKLAESSEIADRHPVPYVLSLPRNLAFVIASIDRVVRDAIPESLADAYEKRRHLQRLEIASAGSDAEALGNEPKLVGLLTFDRDAEREDIDSILEALPALVQSAFDVAEEQADGDSSFDASETSFSSGRLESFGLSDSHPAHPFHYFANPEAGRAFVFFSHGIDRRAAQREVEAIKGQERAPMNDRAFFLRLEPATAVASLSAFDTETFDPFQPGILAQRLGALILSVSPDRAEDLQKLRYRLELRRPPEL